MEDQEEEQGRGSSEPEEALPAVKPVQIVGAARVGIPNDPASSAAIGSLEDEGEAQSSAVDADAPSGDTEANPVVELPHWTDPPTGQVPAFLERLPVREANTPADEASSQLAPGAEAFGQDQCGALRGEGAVEEGEVVSSPGEGAVPAVSPPVWREHDHDWEQAGLETALLVGENASSLGVLPEVPEEERRPWDFDTLLPTVAVPGGDESEEDTGADQSGAEGTLDAGEPVAADPRAGSAVSTGQVMAKELAGDLADQAGGALSLDDNAMESESGMYGGGAGEPAGGWSEQRGSTATLRDSEAARPGDSHSDEPAVPSSEEGGEDPWAALGEPGVAHEGGRRERTSPHGRLRKSRSRGKVAEARVQRSAAAVGRHRGPGAGRDLPVAVGTGVGFGLLVLVAFGLGPAWSVAFLTLIVVASAAEGYAALRKAKLRPATFPGLLATVALMLAVYADGLAAAPIVLACLVVATFAWQIGLVARKRRVLGGARSGVALGVASTVLVFLWVGFFGSFAALLVSPGQFPDRHGIAFLLGALIATVADDTLALAAGRLFGRHPMAPVVSPNKTWEGLAGGAIGAVVISFLVTGYLISPWTPSSAAILGAVVAVVAPLGDLAESLVKRDLGLKDMGTLLPGHGGLLDRLDALLFVMPAAYYLARVLRLG